MITKVKVEEAIGKAIAHDITKVVPGFKGPAFRRGHIITRKDIPELLRIGKEHIYILSLGSDEVHEEEAALRIANAVKGRGLMCSPPHEGRVSLITASTGLLKVDVAALDKINSIDEITVAAVRNNTVCQENMVVAAMRITPLYISGLKLDRMEQIARDNQPVISLVPFKLKKIGLIISGNEVFKGLIKDGFSPVMHKKAEDFGCTINNQAVVPDDADVIASTILQFQIDGSEVILCCGGMSVDPDDVTLEGIRKSGAEVRFYGLPVMPGAMTLYARLGSTHILGIPAGALHSNVTAFDRLLPVVLSGEELTFRDTRKLGHGGLCLKCKQCNYPACPFCS
ncbi:MAG: molybdopterin-binding protein [Dehalococcoidales bacterium]|nr:molybdopterin-binding protein [Dehalococcoidales bacterium]